MSDIVPMTYTTYNVGISHARRAGERYAICGMYVWMGKETIVPEKPLCKECLSTLAAELPSDDAGN